MPKSRFAAENPELFKGYLFQALSRPNIAFCASLPAKSVALLISEAFGFISVF